MKKYFLTGLAILLPLALTLVIIVVIFNFLTAPFVGVVRDILDYFNLLEIDSHFLSSLQIQTLFSKVIILALLFFFTIFLGVIARWFFVRFLLKWWDSILHRIPIVSSIYKVCQEVIKTVFTSNSKSFKQVVLVPFPSADSKSVGLVTCDHVLNFPDGKMAQTVAVFVPTTPNPTSGFLMFFDAKDLVYLDMKVDEALKYVISCGVIMAPFSTLPAEKARSMQELQEGEIQ